MHFTRYQDQSIFYIRKPHNLPTVFGKEKSFLDFFSDFLNSNPNHELAGLKIFFNAEQEFGLLNRLDNETAGLLYFAKTPNIFFQFKALQKENKIQKIYLASLSGNLQLNYPNQKTFEVNFPLAHHKFQNNKMLILREDPKLSDEELLSKYSNKINGKIHRVTSKFEILDYDPENNSTLCKIYIHKGVRHQIRLHSLAIGSPILGDSIYFPKSQTPKLQLYCIGLSS